MTVKRLSVWESDSPRTEDWHILLCENDEYGNATGRIQSIEVRNSDHDEASFSHNWNGVRGGIGDNFIRIGRRKFPITGVNFYVGNIFWNLVTVTPKVGAEIMSYIKKLPAFQCEGGTVEFCQRFGF
jgi:hypothetical protein